MNNNIANSILSFHGDLFFIEIQHITNKV